MRRVKKGSDGREGCLCSSRIYSGEIVLIRHFLKAWNAGDQCFANYPKRNGG
jgi:hypothetical protein